MVAACPMPARRGTPLRVERLAQALAARGHAVELITYHLAEEDGVYAFPIRRIYDRVERGTLPPGPTVAKLVRYDPALARLVRSRVRSAPFDVIHAHHYEGLLAAAYGCRGTDVPLIYDAHTLLSAELPSYGAEWSRRFVRVLGRRLDRLLPRFADHMIVVTEDILQQLSQELGFDPAQITVITNGVEVETFLAIRGSVEPRPELLVYTGTLAPYQGIDLMLEAFAKALAQRPHLRLRLLTGADFTPFQGVVERLGVGHALEIMEDSFRALPERLAEASVALMPRPECPGIPQKLLNYMAAARGIVSFAGSAKLLRDDLTGLVVANRDTDAFARAIVRLADDPALARRLGNTARAEVIDTATWDRAAVNCEAVYRMLLEGCRQATGPAGFSRLQHGMPRPDELTPAP